MKKFCESLKEHSMKIINFENKKMIALMNNELESYAMLVKKTHICKKKNTDKLYKLSWQKQICWWSESTEILKDFGLSDSINE